MNIFWKIAGIILTALILWLSLSKNNKDFAVLLTIAVCAMALLLVTAYLQPVVEFIRRIQTIGNLDKGLFSVVLKVIGIGMVTELSAMICKDAGNESMAKTIQLVSAATVLWLSIPVFEKLLSLLDRILGAV